MTLLQDGVILPAIVLSRCDEFQATMAMDLVVPTLKSGNPLKAIEAIGVRLEAIGVRLELIQTLLRPAPRAGCRSTPS